MSKQKHYKEPGTTGGLFTTWYVKTGEFRPPNRGEFYLSGAIPEVWEAYNDLLDPYHIMCQVEDPKQRIKINNWWYKLDPKQED